MSADAAIGKPRGGETMKHGRFRHSLQADAIEVPNRLVVIILLPHCVYRAAFSWCLALLVPGAISWSFSAFLVQTS
jgi:hypothetical protein